MNCAATASHNWKLEEASGAGFGRKQAGISTSGDRLVSDCSGHCGSKEVNELL